MKNDNSSLIIKALFTIIGFLVLVIFLLFGWKISKWEFLGAEIVPPATSTLKFTSTENNQLEQTPVFQEEEEQQAVLLTPAPNSTIIFRDDFNDGFKTEWDVVEGEYFLSDGIPILDVGNELIILLGEENWNNFAIDLDVKKAYFPTILFAYTSENFYNYIYYSSGNSSYVYVSDGEGTHRRLSTPDREVPDEFHLRLEISNNSLKMYVDGDEVYDLVFQTQLSGKVGLIHNGNGLPIAFDNFEISTLAP